MNRRVPPPLLQFLDQRLLPLIQSTSSEGLRGKEASRFNDSAREDNSVSSSSSRTPRVPGSPETSKHNPALALLCGKSLRTPLVPHSTTCTDTSTSQQPYLWVNNVYATRIDIEQLLWQQHRPVVGSNKASTKRGLPIKPVVTTTNQTTTVVTKHTCVNHSQMPQQKAPAALALTNRGVPIPRTDTRWLMRQLRPIPMAVPPHQSPLLPALKPNPGTSKASNVVDPSIREPITSAAMQQDLSTCTSSSGLPEKCYTFHDMQRHQLSQTSPMVSESPDEGEREKKKEEEGRGPTPAQLSFVLLKLREELPSLFLPHYSMDWHMYSPDMVFESNLFRWIPSQINGRTAYWSFLAMLRHVVRCCYSNLEVQLLKITKETDEGQVQVRWRLCGHPRWSLSSLLWMRPPESWGGRGRGRKGASSSIVGREEGEGEGRGRDREGEEEGEGEEEKEGGRMVVVTDGFSVFTVNSEGKIQKHKLDRRTHLPKRAKQRMLPQWLSRVWGTASVAPQ